MNTYKLVINWQYFVRVRLQLKFALVPNLLRIRSTGNTTFSKHSTLIIVPVIKDVSIL